MELFSKLNMSLRKKAANYAFRGMRRGADKLFRGKDSAELTAEGGWHALVGTILDTGIDNLFKNYQDYELESIPSKSAVVYACFSLIGKTIQEAPMEIGTMVDGVFEADEDHPLMPVLKSPNPLMSMGSFNGHSVIHMLSSGDSYIWKKRNNAGYIDQLVPIPSSWVKKLTDSNGVVIGYEIFQGGSNWLKVPYIDLTRVYLADPANPANGLGPLEAATRDYETDSERQKYMIEMLKNMKIPGLLMTKEEGWEVDEIKVAKEILSDVIGTTHRGDPLFLGGKGAKAEFVAPLKDLDWPGLTNLSETRICSVMGIDPIILSLRSGEGKTFRNYEEAERAFYRQTMVGWWTHIQEGYTRGLLWDEGEEQSTIIRFNLETVKQLLEDVMQATKRALELFTGGLATRGESQRIAGIQIETNPLLRDVYRVPIGVQEVHTNTKSVEELQNEAMGEHEVADFENNDEEGGEGAGSETGINSTEDTEVDDNGEE